MLVVLGAALHGDETVQRVQSSFIHAPGLIHLITKPDAWMSYLYAPERAGNLVAIDGKELWLVHNYLLPGELDFDTVDRDACIRLLLGVEPSFEYELLAKEDWVKRRLVVNKLRARVRRHRRSAGNLGRSIFMWLNPMRQFLPMRTPQTVPGFSA